MKTITPKHLHYVREDQSLQVDSTPPVSVRLMIFSLRELEAVVTGEFLSDSPSAEIIKLWIIANGVRDSTTGIG
jgi:hypothetical protein